MFCRRVIDWTLCGIVCEIVCVCVFVSERESKCLCGLGLCVCTYVLVHPISSDKLGYAGVCVCVPKDSTRGRYKSNFALHPQMQLSASHRLSKQGEGRRDSLSDRSTLAPRQIDFGPAVARKRGLGGWEPWPTPYHTPSACPGHLPQGLQRLARLFTSTVFCSSFVLCAT